MNHIILRDQERLAFCLGLPSGSDAAEKVDLVNEIEALEAENEELHETVELLERWRDGDMEAELEEAQDTIRDLKEHKRKARDMLSAIGGLLRSTDTKTVAGRAAIAKDIQAWLVTNR